MDRRWELDALRGLMLVLMTVTHLPTRLAGPLGQPFGFVSAAEGFVFLSAYMAGRVYTRRHQARGALEMRSAFLQRAFKVYLCQVGLLLFLFSIVAVLGALRSQAAVTDMLAFYLERPLTAFVAGLALVYNPPLLDILPMYVLFMLASPLLLMHGLRHGWGVLLAASVLLWLGEQFGLGPWLYERVAGVIGLAVPQAQTGAFQFLAWQFLWLLGLWMGAEDAAPSAPPRALPAWLLRTAWVWALGCLVWRHAVGQAPFGADESLNLLFDKWRLAPLRLIDFFALLLLVMHHGPWLKARLPRLAALEMLGRAALPVFCTHLAATLVVLALVGAATPERPLWIDLAVLAATFAAMGLVAALSGLLDRRTAALRERFSVRRSSSAAARPGAPR